MYGICHLSLLILNFQFLINKNGFKQNMVGIYHYCFIGGRLSRFISQPGQENIFSSLVTGKNTDTIVQDLLIQLHCHYRLHAAIIS